MRRICSSGHHITVHCVTLWIGPALGAIERACLLSVLRQGHGVTLYSYGRPDGVPDGVEVRDAAEIIPEDKVVRHISGSPALFANRFRYELQRQGLGTWIDCDIYLLSPLDGSDPYLFGEEAAGLINNGILRLPTDSPLLAPLLAIFEERSVPPWLPLRSKVAACGRLLSSGKSGLSQMPWGSAGPRALSYLARRYQLDHWARGSCVFYPVRWQDALWISDPAIDLCDVTTPDTVAVHLWNERIKGVKAIPAAPGSFLARLQGEGRV